MTVRFEGGPEDGAERELDEPRKLYIVSTFEDWGWDSLGAPIPIYRDAYYHWIASRGVYEFQGSELV